MKTHTVRVGSVIVALLVAAALCSSCSSALRQSRSSSYLIVDTLSAASGARPNEFNAVLQSDVITLVKVTTDTTSFVPTVFADMGKVTLRLALKDIGTSTSPTTPTANNEITVTQYHVSFTRADGRNTAGVDVPYAFDGAVTGTIGPTGATLAFELVRAQAKFEAPLRALQNAGGSLIISTIATVTFYGVDQVGNQVSVTGKISVDFADWGDPL